MTTAAERQPRELTAAERRAKLDRIRQRGTAPHGPATPGQLAYLATLVWTGITLVATRRTANAGTGSQRI